MARDLGIPPEKVRVVCQYMGGNFGNKNQNQDADLIAAVLAKEAGAPVKLELSRKEDFIGVHGRWPTAQYYKVGVKNDGTLQAIQLRGYSGMGPYRKNTGNIAGVEIYQCPNIETVVSPVYTNRTVSANFRGPEFPQGFFGIQSMMDDVAAKLKMDPVEFILKNMTRKVARRDAVHRPTRSTSASAAAPRRSTGRSAGGRSRDPIPVRSSAAPACRSWRSAPASAAAAPSIRVDAKGKYAVHVGVTDVGGGAKTTMGLIAAEALGVPLSQVEVVWGDTDRCPYSVGESGSRTTIMTGYAVVEAARDLKKQIAEKGHAEGRRRADRVGDAEPDARRARCAARSARTSSRSRSTPSSAACASPKYLAVHDCGRIINPLTATQPDQGRRDDGHRHGAARGSALRPPQRQPLTAGYYGARDRDASRRAGRSRSSSSRPTMATGRSARRAWARRARCRRRRRSPTRSSTPSACA